MSIPLSMLPSDLIWNGQLDVSNGVKQAEYDQLNNAYNNAGSGGGGGFQQVQPPDLKAIEDKVYNQLKPYYLQLLTESNGDYTRAVDRLHQDYQKGIRVASEDFGTQTGQELASLHNSLNTLGINFNQEQDKKVDELNSRGMAVYQNSPDGQYNVVQKTLPNSGSMNPAGAAAGQVDNSGINPTESIANSQNLGEGGNELNQTLQDQQLRQEAVQRASNNKLQQYGIDYKRLTNPNATDPSQQGALENSQNRGLEDAARQKQQTGENLYNQLQNQTLQISQGFANSGVNADKANLDNKFSTDQVNQFINKGVL